MPDILAIHAANTPDKIAVVDPARDRETSFQKLNALVNQIVRAFSELGIKRGERLVWCGPNSLFVLAVIHAARKAGLVAVPLSYRFTGEEMAYVIDNSGASIVIIDAEQSSVIAPHVGNIISGSTRRRARRTQ